MSNGQKHDGRAPDYDDWSTVAENGQVGLNGDLLVWDDVLNRSMELSSMGIRVDKEALLRQLKACNAEEKKELYFHKRLLSGELPQSIGGGIGQSRLCMFYLRKAHIGRNPGKYLARRNASGSPCCRNAINLTFNYGRKDRTKLERTVSPEFEKKDYFKELINFVKTGIQSRSSLSSGTIHL